MFSYRKWTFIYYRAIYYVLGDKLYPNGDGKTVTGRNGDTKAETDGGYLIKHIWL